MADLAAGGNRVELLDDGALLAVAGGVADAFGLGDDLAVGASWPTDEGDRVVSVAVHGAVEGRVLLAVNAGVATRLLADPGRLADGVRAAVASVAAEVEVGDVDEVGGERPARAVEVRDDGRTCALVAIVGPEVDDDDGDDAPTAGAAPFEAVVVGERAERPTAAARPPGEVLLDVQVEVTIELGRTTMSLREIVDLHPGDVIELGRSADAPVDLTADGLRIGRGRVVVIGEQYGVRIVDADEPDGPEAAPAPERGVLDGERAVRA